MTTRKQTHTKKIPIRNYLIKAFKLGWRLGHEQRSQESLLNLLEMEFTLTKRQRELILK